MRIYSIWWIILSLNWTQFFWCEAPVKLCVLLTQQKYHTFLYYKTICAGAPEQFGWKHEQNYIVQFIEPAIIANVSNCSVLNFSCVIIYIIYWSSFCFGSKKLYGLRLAEIKSCNTSVPTKTLLLSITYFLVIFQWIQFSDGLTDHITWCLATRHAILWAHPVDANPPRTAGEHPPSAGPTGLLALEKTYPQKNNGNARKQLGKN